MKTISLPKNGEFDPDIDLMVQLDKLDENTASTWYKTYLEYHNGIDQGISYLIGYFADVTKRNNLYKWFKIK